MARIRDWQRNREMWVRLLEKQTGQNIDDWNRRIMRQRFADEQALRNWLSGQGVNGYARALLVMERFGYPAFVTASAGQLIDAQYADRQQLRPIYDAIERAANGFGELIVQARKTYVSLVTPRRTFARVQPTTRTRVDLGLRLEGQRPTGRLQPSTIHETMNLQIGLTRCEDVDDEAARWLARAYRENS
jgi:hypothetical protein